MEVVATAQPRPHRDPTSTGPTVLAVVVSHQGSPWLERTLDALTAQTYEALEVVGVDNGSSDSSRRILVERLGHDRVLVAERDLGFGAAVGMALDTALAREARYLLLLHDDSAPDPDAVRRLVEHLEQFPDVAVAGPKKVAWDDPGRLQSVGWSVDVTGRATSGLEPDERDQGQRDQIRRVLYTSSSGMLVRREVFQDLGGFDRRYHLFRDDLDLCWRIWLAGHEVEVVPEARVRHVASASNYGRLGKTAVLGPRYFAERNTLATLLKNYGPLRLVTMVPLFFLVGALKVLGFLLTRRVGDAWQTVRAWFWNGLHLRETWRLRREVQARRRVSDRELRPLFARLVPRAQAYLEAVLEWIGGGGGRARDGPSEPVPIWGGRLVRLVRRRPVGAAALLLGLAGLVVAFPLLLPGTLRGGELVAWPDRTAMFLGDYVSAWHDAGPVGTSGAPSPAQALLGMLDALALGSRWLAPRLLVLGALPVAWVLSLRAARLLSRRPLPRLVGATVYVLSPPVLAALQTGRISALVTVVALPGLAIAFGAVLRRGGDPSRAWRATAVAVLLGAVAVAFAPATALALLVWILVALAGVAAWDQGSSERRATAARLGLVLVGVVALLLPWSVGLVLPDGPLFGGGGGVVAAGDPLWRWLLLSPTAAGFPGPLAGAGLVAAGALAIALVFPERPLAVAGLWVIALAGVGSGWGLAHAGEGAFAWAGLPLVLGAGAFAGLLVLSLDSAVVALARQDFGWPHAAGGLTLAAVAVGLLTSGGSFLGDPWAAYLREEPPLPAFLASEAETVGPFRVLVLGQDDRGLGWDVTGASGPTMAGYGVPVPEAFVTEVDAAVGAMAGMIDPGAAGRLGLLNVRYVVVPPGAGTDGLGQALDAQLGLEPQPVASGQVYLVDGALPRAGWLPPPAVRTIAAQGEVPVGVRHQRLEAAEDGGWRGEVPGPGAVVVSEVEGSWSARTEDGRELEASTLGPVLRFDVGEDASGVRVVPTGGTTRTVLVLLQAVLLLGTVSLALRPPGFVRSGTDPATVGPSPPRSPA